MSENNKQNRKKGLSILNEYQSEKKENLVGGNRSVDLPREKSFWKKLGGLEKIGVIGLCMLLVAGAMGSGLGNTIINSLIGNSDTNGSQVSSSKNVSDPIGSILSKINPFASAVPSNTPQLSKEYIYAGSRMLAVEDAGATAAISAELAVWKPSSGTWKVQPEQGGTPITQQWGMSGDVPLPADFDGDGKADFTVYREVTGNSSIWYHINSSDGQIVTYAFGSGDDNDIPISADFDGDGKADRAVYRPAGGMWYIARSSDGGTTIQAFGISTDMPSVDDYDGDGKADIAVWRKGDKTFHTLNSSDGSYFPLSFANSGAQTSNTEAVSGDYDGDGKADYAIREANSWMILESTTNQFTTVNWQDAGDVSVPHDYDGDGKIDVAVWRNSNSGKGAGDAGKWFIRNSSDPTTPTEVVFGDEGDIPVPAKYRR